MSDILTFSRVGYHFGSHWAVREVSASLSPGITGLLGANGAGKTTLMRLAMGLLTPHEGSVSLFGTDPVRAPVQRLRVGYLPQRFEPPRWMRVRDYVSSLAVLAGVNSGSAGAIADQTLSLVGLAGKGSVPLGALSGGMLRRVGVAQALTHGPDLLLLDEPAAGLDPEERMRLHETLWDIAQTRPVVVSTHLVDEIEREADTIWMVKEGHLVWSGPIRDALLAVRGQIREGVLAIGERPEGRVVSKRPTADGTLWRVISTDERLAVCEPMLLDAYMHYAGRVG
jgi:ABC-2 type transport system ATP-binding protein